MIQYRILESGEICRELFQNFTRRQIVTKCWRREKGIWVVKDAPFVDDWTEEDYRTLIDCLKNTVDTGGVVYAALCGNVLKGFVSVEPCLFGGEQKYLDLSSLHVSEDMRHMGIGTSLFLLAKEWAGKQGAHKLYISAHSAVEIQNFYKKWAAWRHRFITNSMPPQNHMTASWNAALYRCENPAAGQTIK